MFDFYFSFLSNGIIKDPLSAGLREVVPQIAEESHRILLNNRADHTSIPTRASIDSIGRLLNKSCCKYKTGLNYKGHNDFISLLNCISLIAYSLLTKGVVIKLYETEDSQRFCKGFN